MTPVLNHNRLAAAAAVLLVIIARPGVAQTSTSQAAPLPTPAPASAASTIELTPAQPRQGSVVKVTLRLPAAARDSLAAVVTGSDTLPKVATPSDTMPRAAARIDSVQATVAAADSMVKVPRPTDTLPSVTIGIAAGLDSLRAVLDTLRPRPAAAAIDTVADTTALIRASLFGEPLHFQREPTGEYTALAAIPVDAPAAVNVSIIVARGGMVDTVATRLAIRRTAYKMEKLTVAPRFGQAPDSALAARIAREQALAAEVSRNSHLTPRLWEGEFQRPRTARVTSAFGDGREFNGRVQSRHMGLDLAGATGAPVLASNRGVVALVGDFYYAGNAVYIDHGAGLVTAYFHLSAVDVAKGDTVTPGMRIGRVGATGRVTGPHLHWVARYGAVTVDPSTLLDITPDEVPAKAAPPSRRDSTTAAPPRRDSTTAAPPPRSDSTTAVDSARAAVSPPPHN